MKYFISELFYKFNSTISNYNGSFDYNLFKNQGLLIIPNFFKNNEINKIKESINWEKFNWNDKLDSDRRIYNFKNNNLNLLDSEIDKFYKKYISLFRKEDFWMANKVVFKKNNLGSGGGWHRDSLHRRQLKFMVYISDVNIDNGPFEYIPKTHSVYQKFNFGLKNGFNKLRYTNTEIDNFLAEKRFSKKTCIAKKGSLIVFDSSGLHRGSPIIAGERVAITKYLFDTGVPNDMKSIYS